MNNSKIINDPVYGFLTIPSELVFKLIQHPFFQRLRRIRQLGMTEFVYPGAIHSRFNHALGALNLMTKAVDVLRQKKVIITDEEAEAVYIGILLHDIGHGPFSHSLEHNIIQGVHHEFISLTLMNIMNKEFDGKLSLAIKIFQNKYKKEFLHQLISSQLDMDRLDYLSRDSFFTGVSEGVVGADRIINMMNVVNDQLVIEEKGIYSIEKFIIARRLMYWQVYLHKAVVAADMLLSQIMKRAKELSIQGVNLYGTPALKWFLEHDINEKEFLKDKKSIHYFTSLDDSDVFSSIKVWQTENDKILSTLSKQLINRNLPKMQISNKAFSADLILESKSKVAKLFNLNINEASYFVNQISLSNDAYKDDHSNIKILLKNNQVVDVVDASDNYNLKTLKTTVKKYFLSYYKEKL